MKQLRIDSPATLKQEIQLALQPFIGSYQRPDLPDAPALWVLASPVPRGYKVLTALETETVAPALEVLVGYAPEYVTRGRNLQHTAIDEGYRVWLVFHDLRQDPRPAIRSIARNFQYAGEIDRLPETDDYRLQYTLLITNKLLVEQP